MEQVLRDNQDKDIRNEFVRMAIADKIHEQYTNLVKQIATKYLEYEASRRSTIHTFNKLAEKK